ncbi:MAG: septal ring lytic transglycosylase RlpA family protein [Sandaracinaceae bacterium]|nr:septal ring lytic transglycosylase RlpA family protein [Sandaracinaceae bacterium]
MAYTDEVPPAEWHDDSDASEVVEEEAQADGVNPLDAQYAHARALSTQTGRASYYHDSLHGNHTANGEVYDIHAFTAASRTLPFDTIVRVVRLDDPARWVIVRVNDRGPFGDAGRLLDLSHAAAERLGSIEMGVARVRLEILSVGDGPRGHGRIRPRRGRRH